MSACSTNEIDIKYEPLPSTCLEAPIDKTSIAPLAVAHHGAPQLVSESEPFIEVNFKEEPMEMAVNDDALHPIEEIYCETQNLKSEEPGATLLPDDGDPLTDINEHATKSETDTEYPTCEPMAFVSMNNFECSRCLKTFTDDRRLQLHALECRAKDSTYTRGPPKDSSNSVTRCVTRRSGLLHPRPVANNNASANGEEVDGKICNCVVETLKLTPFRSLDFDKKIAILKAGRPTPELPMLQTKTKTCKRKFSVRQYQEFPWLAGCKGTNKLYCWPCMFFSSEPGPFQKWGYDDLNNFAKATSRHELSKLHLQSWIELKTFGNSRVDLQIENQNRLAVLRHNEAVQKNRSVLERLIRAACHLGMNEINFGDGDRTDISDNRGNYVDSVLMLSEYDLGLSRHLSEATAFSGLSNSVQNGLISSIGSVMLDQIKTEIKEAPFLAISLYNATNAWNLSQISSVFRYVDKRGEVVERFVEFSDMGGNRTATALGAYIFSLLEAYEGTTKLVAQTYDGAIVQPGQLSELQAKVKGVCPEALLVHSSTLGLNLVLSQAFQYSNSECKIFFKTVRGLAAFFSESEKRTKMLDRELKKRFPSVCPTQWSYDRRLVETLAEKRKEIIAMFEGILNDPDSWDVETFNMARGYLPFLESFDANFLLTIFSEIFPLTDQLFQSIQSKIDDIAVCVKFVTQLKMKLLGKRTEFNRFWEKGLEMSPNPPEARKKRLKNEEIEGSYKQLFFEILDNLEQQINLRFHDLGRLAFLNLVDCKRNPENAEIFPVNAFHSLQQNYKNKFDFPRLKSELVAFYCSKKMEHKGVQTLLKFIIDNDLEMVFPQLAKLCALIMTIPAENMPDEKSIGKRIETYLRNATGQARHPQFNFMAIEKQMLATFLKPENRAQFYERVIIDFIDKSERTELTFK